MSIYAVIETGGKQYRVQPGQIFQAEKLEGEVGKSVDFSSVLFVSKPGETSQVWLGKPTLAGAKVSAEIVGQGRGEKLLTVKMKRRKQYRRTIGHRQELTQLIVTLVDNGAGEKASLSAEDKKAALAKFQSHLKPRGNAFTPKTLGSRKRLAAARAAQFTGAAKGETAAASKKAAPKKTTAKK